MSSKRTTPTKRNYREQEKQSEISTKPLRTNPPGFLQLQNRPPQTAIARWIWSKRLWIEATFSLSMMEGWEKIIIGGIFTIAFCLLGWSIYYYLPTHIQFLIRRGKYYLLGDEKSTLSFSSLIYSQMKGEL